MARWADLFIEALDEDMIEFLERNRIRVVGLWGEVLERYREALEKRGFVVVPRVYIEDIERLAPSREGLVSFRPRDKISMRRGGKVGSVMTIVIDEENSEYCTEEQIEVMRGGPVALEILARPLIYDDVFPRYLRHIKTCVRRALSSGVDVVLSSGARRLEELFPPGGFRLVERFLTGLRGSLTYSWYTVLERWDKRFVEKMRYV